MAVVAAVQVVVVQVVVVLPVTAYLTAYLTAELVVAVEALHIDKIAPQLLERFAESLETVAQALAALEPAVWRRTVIRQPQVHGLLSPVLAH